MPVTTLVFLKRSLVRHPLLWLAGMIILGAILAGLGIYHAGYRQHAIDITPTTIQTADGREFNLYIPPRIGFTFRPFVSFMYLDTARAGAGIEIFRFYSWNIDGIISVPMFEEFENERMAIGAGISYDVNYNWSLGATYQKEFSGDDLMGAYFKWRF